MNDSLRQAQAVIHGQQNEIEDLKRELAAFRAVQCEQQQRGGPVSGPNQYNSDQYGRARAAELPPLRALQSSAGPPPPDAMSGVQYEPRPMKGYRPEQGRF